MSVQRQPDAANADEFLLVLTTCGSDGQARALADSLVAAGLAACVNSIPGIESVYRWQGAVERGQEILLVIKTSRTCYDAVAAAIRAASDYELPEILAVPVAGGSGEYLNWLAAALMPPATTES